MGRDVRWDYLAIYTYINPKNEYRFFSLEKNGYP